MPITQVGFIGASTPRKSDAPPLPALELHLGELLPALVEQVADTIKELAHLPQDQRLPHVMVRWRWVVECVRVGRG